MAGCGVDQALVEGLENIDADILQAKSVHVPRNPHDQFLAGLGSQQPVEEIRLALSGDTEIGESIAMQKCVRVPRRGLDHGRPGDRLRDHGEIGMLQEQGVVADLGSIGKAQKLIPKLPLQLGFRSLADGGPKFVESVEGAPRGQALAPELALDGVRIGL